MVSRRNFFVGAAVASAASAVSRVALAAETTLALAQAGSEAAQTREALRRELGLDNFSLPDQLPPLPATLREPGALQARVDVQAAQQAVALSAQALGLTRVTGWVDVLELGFERNSRSGLPVQRGFELRLELPLFDWGQARSARAESVYRQALERAADVAWRAASEQRTADERYRTAYAVARRYVDEVLPLQRRIADETLLRYNGMLIGVFDLMRGAREQAASVQAGIAAQRDFFLAESEFEQSLLGPASSW